MMGEKGKRQSAAGAATAELLVDALAPLGEVSSRKMFGGFGVFLADTMFALVDSEGTPFLRADDTTVAAFSEAGSEKHTRMPYWRIPAHVLENEEHLLDWGRRAFEVAKTSKG